MSQFCHLIVFHCLDGPGFSKRIVKNYQYKLSFVLCTGDYVLHIFMSRREIHKCVRTHQQYVLTVVFDGVSLIVGIKATPCCDGLIVNALDFAGVIVPCFYGEVKRSTRNKH